MKNTTKYIVFALIIISIPVFLYSFDKSFFADVKQRADLKRNEYLVITFLNPGSCVKCYIEPDAIYSVIDRNKGILKIKHLAMIRCDREIELKSFRRERDWEHAAFVDEGEARKKLGCKANTLMAVFNYDGKLQGEFQMGKVNKNIDFAKELMKNLQN